VCSAPKLKSRDRSDCPWLILVALASLPVLFVTADWGAEMAAQDSALGGIDYVTKPLRKEVLLALIRSHLRRWTMSIQ